MPAMNEPDEGAVIFSLLDDAVWVSWSGKSPSVKLGRSASVIYMMRDFLAQYEIGERLNRRKSGNT